MIRILYLDDEPALLDIGKTYLELKGEFSVDTVPTFEEAREKILSVSYDAIISDYEMPGISGIDFLKYVRTRHNNLPFILFTGRGREEVVIEALNNGADFYLQKGGAAKPQFTELKHKIRLAIERRQAIDELSESRQRMTDIIDHLPDATFAIDLEGKVIAWNRAIEEMTEVKKDEILGKGDHAYAIPFYGIRRPILLDLILRQDKEIEKTYSQIIRKDKNLISEICSPLLFGGRGAFVWFIASPLYDTHGNITGAIESIRDITARKKAEVALRESEQKYRAILDNIQDVFYRTDREGNLIMASSSWASLSGYDSLDECIGKNIAETFYQDPATRKDLLDILKRDGSVSDFEIVLKKKDGSPLYISANSHLCYDEAGAVGGVEGIFRDITERKKAEENLLKKNEELRAAYEQLTATEEELRQNYEELNTSQQLLRQSEERFRNVVEDQTEFICRFTPDGKLTFVNSAYCRYFGLDRESCIGSHHMVTIHPEDVPWMKQHFSAFSLDNPVAGIEHRIVMPSGTIQWQRWSDRAIFDNNGQITEFQSVGRDITTRKQAEENLLKKNEELRAAYEQLTATEEELRQNYEELNTSQQLLRQSEEKFRTLVETSPDITWEINKQGIFHYISPNVQTIMGYQPKELVGRSITDLIPEEARPNVMQELSRHVTVPGPIVPLEVSARHRDGYNLFLEIRPSAVTGPDGNLIGLRGLAIDITERRIVDDALKESEEKYCRFFRTSRDSVFITSMDGCFIDFNDALGELFGYSDQELMQVKVEDLYANPEDRARHISIIAERGFTREFPVDMRRKDGSVIHTLITSVAWYGAEGNVSGFQGTIRDITERRRVEEVLKEKEAFLNSIFHGSPVLQFVVDRNHRVVSWNRALERYTGIKAEEVIDTDQHWKPFYHEPRPCLADLLVDDAVEVLPMWYEKKIKKSPIVEGAFEAIDYFPSVGAAGAWLYFTAAPVRDTHGTITGSIETLVDITERKMAERSLQKVNEKLNILNSITRHDILNQIMALRVYIELARDKTKDKEILAFIEKKDEITQTIQKQIEFTRNYQNIGIHAPEWQNVADVIGSAVSQLKPFGINVTVAVAGVEIFIDPLIEKVFYNLMENSLRHGEHVTWMDFSQQVVNGVLMITYCDNGVGITAEDKKKLFWKGFGKHTGLGLFLSREILSITGITITENGTPGKGARFEILVPTGAYRFNDST